jgi:undecaprenyl-diphosphatase
MGFAQALALLPGISRSGMTIASARMQRIDTHKCAEFSFLMSAPLIAGGAVLEFIKSVRDVSAVQNEPSWALTAFGAVIAAVVGYFSLKILIKALGGKWFWLFGPHCIAVGLLTLLFA